MSFTLVIPTKDREALLTRQLRYYADTFAIEKADDGHDAGFPVIVADSTADGIRDYASATPYIRPIRYHPGISIFEKLHNALTQVRTPLVVIGADDDFFYPPGLRRAAEWLTGHPDYALCSGKSLTFDADLHLAPYPQHSREGRTPEARLLENLGNYSTTWYSMQRTAQARENYAVTLAAQLDYYHVSELLPSCLSVIAGKSKVLPDFYMARQVWPERRPSPDQGEITERQWIELEILLQRALKPVNYSTVLDGVRNYRRPHPLRRYRQILRTVFYQSPPEFAHIREYLA